MSEPQVRFATGTTVTDFDWYRQWLDVAEGAGFDMLTTGDSQSLWADPFVSLMFAAVHTSRPRLGITVSNPMTRHPAVVASQALALQQVSGDRFVYGLASGDSALRNIKMRPAKVAEIEEYVLAVRSLAAGEATAWRGEEIGVHWDRRPVPIWLAAEGPRMQRLAGRIADGVVLSNALEPEITDLALANVRAGADEAGRSIDDIEIWWFCNVVPAATEAEGVDSIRFLLAGTANHVYRFHMEGKGLPEEVKPKVAALMSEYDSRHHAQRTTSAHNAALVDKYGLKEFLARKSTVAGPTERVVERLREVIDGGARNLIIAQFVEDQLGWMRQFADEIMPELR